jgi:ribonuclease VapC
VSRAVLDASALLALLQDEPGAARVQAALAEGVLMSAVNWAETLSRLAELGVAPDEAAARLYVSRRDEGAIAIVPLDEARAREVARLRLPARHLKLSLGDRACLALGRATGLPVLTTDQAWKGAVAKVKVEVIR